MASLRDTVKDYQDAVSYTHLDVYKRQPLSLLERTLSPFKED